VIADRTGALFKAILCCNGCAESGKRTLEGAFKIACVQHALDQRPFEFIQLVEHFLEDGQVPEQLPRSRPRPTQTPDPADFKYMRSARATISGFVGDWF
jgi:hypothetical protein